ncbi:hypothetical protein [Bacillus suaedaesalsae]|uniref:DUF2975 domain-containing protein n=1 Tax=Bacillus suaedaesalsae TaxID=2810349 RepID=A0ABS2DKL8_9BACI|nr:hypothetical protein [Bacillus suaedaesalsae]MBM6618071.1 hypothetical protein [Bacillus suaedaesalsae]
MIISRLMLKFFFFEAVFLIISGLIFILNLIFWIDNGFAQSVLNIYIGPSSIPIIIFLGIMIISVLLFAIILHKKIKGLKELYKTRDIKIAYVFTLIVHLAIIGISVIVIPKLPDGMDSVLPILFCTCLILIFTILLFSFFISFKKDFKENSNF